MKVLLVEADAAVAEATAMLLRTQGHVVVRASDIDAAWRLAEGDAGPDVIVYDAHMSGGDVFEAIERLREHAGRTIPVVLTTDAPSELSRRAATRRACRVSPKPAFSGELVGLLRELAED